MGAYAEEQCGVRPSLRLPGRYCLQGGRGRGWVGLSGQGTLRLACASQVLLRRRCAEEDSVAVACASVGGNVVDETRRDGTRRDETRPHPRAQGVKGVQLMDGSDDGHKGVGGGRARG